MAWDYTEQGADWAMSGCSGYVETCAGERQSPIDIIQAQTILYPGTETLTFSTSYCDDISGKFINNNHTLKFETSDGNTASNYMTGGPLGTAKYHFLQLHFHWGSSESLGSEHLIDGQR